MRITRVYTGSGDAGTTRLGSGKKVPKDHPRVVAAGSVDTANSAVGCVRSELEDPELDALLEEIQHRLFDTGGVLCMDSEPDPHLTTELRDFTAQLEHQMDQWMEEQGPLEEFILPGGTRAASLLHLARCQVRSAEQRVAALNRTEPVNPDAMQFLNRLSDTLFVMAREANRRAGVSDVLWMSAKQGKE
ncbi:MAG: cob(I)yrinic acid a,c-diamide adenosyltransferase [Planctomycetota bacterium]|jgi:cob(I)alamin adenosyltransferase|nr:cob(I)yrinic acid a,c-diamide adenosyltransferase [Planctomycetota bacterium]MDP7249779.1 cob(I)yrinic acid a,c-diamide adenosyltransferase [Planctomycetota bacterium]